MHFKSQEKNVPFQMGIISSITHDDGLHNSQNIKKSICFDWLRKGKSFPVSGYKVSQRERKLFQFIYEYVCQLKGEIY